MEQQLDFSSVQEALEKAKNILVLIPVNPSLDKVASALALYLSFKKQGKGAIIACPSPMTVAFNRLFSVNKVADRLGNRNLIISFDYQKDSIEKVSYNIENNKFNLVVEPRVGKPSLDPEKVSYSYSGADADLVFTLGAQRLEDFGKFYTTEKKVFEKAMLVNIDNRSQNTKFAQINLVNSLYASCGEIVASLIKAFNLPIDKEIATNLFSAIRANTSNFQSPNTSATTFEIIAWCLQNGANKDQLLTQKPSAPFSGVKPAQPTPVQPKPKAVQPPFSAPQRPGAFQPGSKPTQPPPDWFKPKIFKGGGTKV